jgi:FkbM family methyltransferase
LSLARRLFARVAAPFVVERRLFGFRLLLDVSRSDAQRLLYLEGPRFIAERGLLQELAQPGFRIVDVGANIGYYLLLWERRIGARGRVLCLEPEPDNLLELRRNVEGNGFANVEVVAVAVGASEGTVSIHPGINSSVDPAGAIGVRLARLDGLVSGKVDLLKIDVEGYEGEVLQGARATLERDRPILFVEVHPWLLYAGHSVASILAALRSLYSRIEAYEAVEGQGLLEKAAARYGFAAQVRKLGAARLAALENGAARERPFWIVCRP